MKPLAFLTFLFLLSSLHLQAQHSAMQGNLNKRISVQVTNQRIGDVLERISKAGNFYFSYSGALSQKDSIITFTAQNQPVRHVLDQIFHGNVDYKENGAYIILRPAMYRFSIIPEVITTDRRSYFISGYVADDRSGARVQGASVYEKQLLQSTLTNEEGFFKLRFRGEYQSVTLTASKESYRDTSIRFLASITIKPQGYADTTGDSCGIASDLVERLGIGRFLISSRQRLQSLNIQGFLANSPFQASVLPGLSSHGMMSAQVVNKGSLNIFGGYTAGVDGVEIAGLFNINKNNVKKVQVAGLLNATGGWVKGVQVGGLMNSVLDSVNGVQVAGIINDVRNNVTGVQVAGAVNRDRKSVTGVQVGGVANLLSGNMKGTQVAGVLNKVSKNTDGAQIAGVLNFTGGRLSGSQVGLINYVRRMHGVQVGLINVADTSSGYSIGLLNLVNKGYHKISLYTNEVLNANASIKTGNARLYTMIMGGMNISDTAKAYAAGLGFGHDVLFSNRLSIAAELSSQLVYLGNFDHANILNRFQSHMQLKAFKGFTVFAGPSYTVYVNPAGSVSSPGYKGRIGPDASHQYNSSTRGWLGWNVGVTIM